MRAMATAESDDLLPTRASLLARLKDAAADDSWREFFDLYWKLILVSSSNTNGRTKR